MGDAGVRGPVAPMKVNGHLAEELVLTDENQAEITCGSALLKMFKLIYISHTACHVVSVFIHICILIRLLCC